MRDLKANAFKKDKQKLEWVCKVGGWINDLPIFQDGTDLLREYFRYTPQEPPHCHERDAATCLWKSTRVVIRD